MFGLKANIGSAPRPRHDDRRADVAQFTADRLGRDRFIAFLARGAFLTGAVNNGVMGAGTAGHVDVVDAGMGGQIHPFFRTTIGKGQIAGSDERRQSLLEDRAKIGIDRVHLQDAYLPFRVQLVEYIQWGDARHIARAEHQRYPARRRRFLFVEDGHRISQIDAIDARLHPDFTAETTQQQPIRH